MNVLLINDSSSNPNWGDRAAAIALKQMIKALGGTLNGVITEDDLRESCFLYAQQGATESEKGGRGLKEWGRLLLPPVIPKLRAKILRHLARTGEVEPMPLCFEQFEQYADLFLNDRLHYGRLLEAIEAADVVVIHGDGCMVGNGVLPRSELFLSYLIKKYIGKPVILINHTTDFSHPELDKMAEAVYPLLDDVTYRDQTSAELCLGRWQGRYAADSAFLFEPAERDVWGKLASRPTYFDVWPDEAVFNPGQPYICVGGSSIYSFNGTPTEIIDSFIVLVSHLLKVYAGQIVLTASDLKDQTIFRPVARELKLPLVGLTIPVQQAVDIIGNAQAYVGGRWHPSIFALRGGAPVVPLSSKTFKMQALIAMAGLPASTFNALDLRGEKEALGQELGALLAQGETLRQSLRLWAREQSVNCWDSLTFLSHWLEARGKGEF
jgi:polysaccharide pyruvyl transferase WcaK-like protein